MGLQGLATQDLMYSVRKAGREDLLMNAAGQISGMLKEVRPAARILNDIVAGAAEILSRGLASAVTAVPGA